MRIWAAFIFAVLCATSSSAEPVRVSAGEHNGFTRLLFEFDERPIWDMRRRGAGYRVAFSNTSPVDFDLSRVFRLIDRARVGDIRATGENTIEIDVACECDLHISETGAAALVIDVRDQHKPTVLQNIEAMPELSGQDASPERPDAEVLTDAERTVPRGFPNASVRSHILPELLSSFEGALPSTGLVTDRSVAVELVGRALSRAAAQGLVSANEDIEPVERMPQELANLDVLSDRGNLTVTTGFDRVTRPDLPSVPPTNSGALCIAERNIDVRNWGDPQNADQLGELRSAAIAEDGSVHERGALDLARYYIYLGFGAEARAVSRHLTASENRDILRALAEVIDSGRSEAPVLRGQIACDGAVSLWAALSQPITPDTAPENTDAILSAFSALPPHLRSHLGPLLSERLHDIGLQEQARTALNAVTRGGTRTDESDLATARLQLEGTHAEVARDTLSDLSNGTDITAAGALLELLKDAEARGMAPSPAWVDDAPTLVGALEGTEIAEDLNVAGLRGLIALGRYDAFRSAIVEASPGINRETRRDLSVLALTTATRNGSDADFLASEVGLSKIVEPLSFDREQRVEIASRLAGLGLATRALGYVEGEPKTPEDLALVIDVYVATGRFEDALALARENVFQDNGELLARTLSAVGRHEEAVVALASAGNRDGALAAAIRTGDWSWVTNNGSPSFADAAQALGSPGEFTAQTSDAPNGALIDATRARRAQARALLELTEPTPEAFTN